MWRRQGPAGAECVMKDTEDRSYRIACSLFGRWRRQGLAGAEPKTRRPGGLKLPVTAHGRAAGHGARAGQSRDGIVLNK